MGKKEFGPTQFVYLAALYESTYLLISYENLKTFFKIQNLKFLMNMLLHSCQSHIFQIQIKLTETRMSDEKVNMSKRLWTETCQFGAKNPTQKSS